MKDKRWFTVAQTCKHEAATRMSLDQWRSAYSLHFQSQQNLPTGMIPMPREDLPTGDAILVRIVDASFHWDGQQ